MGYSGIDIILFNKSMLQNGYIFVATLPYSGHAHVEAFLSINQECWISAHANAFKYFGGITKILQCDNLKTGVIEALPPH